MAERLNCDTVTAKPVKYDFSNQNWAEMSDDGETGWRVIVPDFDTAEAAFQYLESEGFGPFRAGGSRKNDPTLDDHELDAFDWYDTGNDDEPYDDVDLIERAREHWQESDHTVCMNYAYPIPSVDAEALLGTCLVGVEIDGETYLGLCGGGMDLSWEICEAYMLCGYMPPTHFCELPRMAGRGSSERDLAIIQACLDSLNVARRWAKGSIERLLKYADC